MEEAGPWIDLDENGGSPVEADGLAELRRLVLGPERAQIISLQHRLDNPTLRAEDVCRVLPEAIIARARQNGDLASALSTSISEAIKASVKRDPQPLVDAVFPVIGPAIRKSIADALLRMMQSLNQTIEYSLSAKSWRWRLEARRTGRPFGEIVLLHTLVYRVEQIFLIHRNTGLLLQHLKADSVNAQDGDMVSGMLTAIQDFVSDSFGAREKEIADELRVGERTVWTVRGPNVIVAAVILGIPPLDLKTKLQQACEQIEAEQATALEAFEGESAPFELCRASLEECLVQATQAAIEKKKPPGNSKRRRAGLAVAGVTPAILLTIWLLPMIRERRAFNAYVRELRKQPGILVISAGREDGKYKISGLRDPLSASPDEFLRNQPRLTPLHLLADWKPYQSLLPRFVLRRARRALAPPATASLSLSDGVLYGHGTATEAWINDARRLAPLFPGVQLFDTRDLIPIDQTAALLQKAREILEPPESIDLTLSNKVLRATGSAPPEWSRNARRLALLIPGVSSWEDSISDTKPPSASALALAELHSQEQALEKLPAIRFNDFFSLDPMAGQDQSLDIIADNIKSLISCAATARVRLRVNVVGHTDSRGIDETRNQISRRRADRVLALLLSRGVAADVLSAVGVADREPLPTGDGVDDVLNRRVSFRIETWP